MRLIVYFFTLFFGKKAGEDEFGNIYYYSNHSLFKRQKRWVVYKGSREPSKVPDYWESWLRHLSEKPIDLKNKALWQKNHLPNLTGTSFANIYKDNHKIKNANSYESWKENKNN